VVTRFLVEPNIAGEITTVDIGDSSSSNSISEDEEFLAEFKLKTESDDSIVYEEKIVKDAAETVAAIRRFNSCNLFLVGIRPTGKLACAMERSECSELGPIGGLLASQDF
ncbi:cation/H(+) antiporter 18-like, partial [Trifolium medium]|nr:cation/H(+) antiporter 18-like [Trifolium medium]